MTQYTIKANGLIQADRQAFSTQKAEGGFIKHYYSERKVVLNTGTSLINFIY